MRSNLQITHPAQERLATSTGSKSSTQFPNSGVGFLLRPTIFVLQMSLQRQHFLLSCLKTLSVGPAGV